MTWAATPTATTWPRSDTNIARCLSNQTMAQQYSYARRMCTFGVRAVALGSGLTRQLPPVGCEHSQSRSLPNPDRDASGCHG